MGRTCFFSSFDSQSRGVAIFIRKNLPIKVLDQFSDHECNLLAILIEFESKVILLEGIYEPNSDCPEFYDTEVLKKILEWNPHHAIFTGDWNLILDKSRIYQNVEYEESNKE